MSDPAEILRRDAGVDETRRASTAFWDAYAPAYQRAHATELGDVAFVWCPEGVVEDSARLLGDLRGKRVLDVGCGAAQTTRWLAAQGAQPVGFDLSMAQLRLARDAPPLVRADAERLPFADGVFDVACSAFGALPFVADIDVVMREVARVLRPGGRWVFPDDPSPSGMSVVRSYFDRTPYVEQDEHGRPSYVEHHHTTGDWIRSVVAAGFVVEDLVEPEWPDGHDRVWGAWGPYRGRFIPGTAIFVCTLR